MNGGADAARTGRHLAHRRAARRNAHAASSGAGFRRRPACRSRVMGGAAHRLSARCHRSVI